jgi:pimeloyl-ACP methyl ester carboxylesterase
MSSKVAFNTTATPWMYSWAGALFFTAIMKLHPIHRELMSLEMANFTEYFAKNSIKGSYKAMQAGISCYVNNIRRVLRLDKAARQDYFALNRHGCFNADALPELPADLATTHKPLVIVPGLNTPPVFFRHMHQYFLERGYPVSVLALPSKGLADVATASKALGDEISRLQDQYQSATVNVVGHCLGGLIGQYYLSQLERPPVKHMVSLSTGFKGSKGVATLKNIWSQNHPSAAIPQVFDELIEWNMNIAHRAGEVAYHNFATVWDFLVEFQNAFLESGVKVTNHLIDDADIDHLTIALNPKMFVKIEQAISSPV